MRHADQPSHPVVAAGIQCTSRDRSPPTRPRDLASPFTISSRSMYRAGRDIRQEVWSEEPGIWGVQHALRCLDCRVYWRESEADSEARSTLARPPAPTRLCQEHSGRDVNCHRGIIAAQARDPRAYCRSGECRGSKLVYDPPLPGQKENHNVSICPSAALRQSPRVQVPGYIAIILCCAIIQDPMSR